MIDYRVYRLDSEGHVLSRFDIKAADDGAALLHAREQMAEHDLEVWQLDRLVGTLRVSELRAA